MVGRKVWKVGGRMTEQEALKYLKYAKRTNDMLCVLPKSDIAECLINALEEIQQYRAIGTVEECREAVEKQIPKKPDYECDGDYAKCPICEHDFEYDINDWGCEYCSDCGQKLDWSDEE